MVVTGWYEDGLNGASEWWLMVGYGGWFFTVVGWWLVMVEESG